MPTRIAVTDHHTADQSAVVTLDGLHHTLSLRYTTGITASIRAMRPRDWVAVHLGGRDVQTGDGDFDRAYRMESTQVTELQALIGPGVRQLLLDHRLLQLTLTPDRIEVRWPSPSSRKWPGVPEATALLSALIHQDTLHWRRAASDRGLRLGDWELSGRLRNTPLTARLLHHHGKVRTEVSAPVGARFTAVHPDHRPWSLRRPLTTGNPILDMAVAIDGPPEVLDTLQAPDMAEALLSVVHRWPGSVVNTSGIHLRAVGRMEHDIGPALDAVAALGALLKRR